jgi:predicted GNAT family acetyltransferase
MKSANAGLLDNPTWAALTTKQIALAQTNPLAVRYDPAVAPFAAVASMTAEALDELRHLLAPGESVVLQTSVDIPAAPELHAERLFTLLQMVDGKVIDSPDLTGIERLSVRDVDHMVDLAQRTNPGPFSARTIETGHYIGLRHEGRLIAMAGERMRLDGFVEISAVCVDDDHRGKGIAGRLMNILRHEIRQRGDVPFLHVRADNASAIGLYRRLGFEDRQMFTLYRLTSVPSNS